jgi:hypothetical protein
VLERLPRRPEHDRLAGERHPPCIRLDRPRDDAAEGRLAGTVLADQRVHRALHDGERHARKRLDAAEVLGDVQELEERTRFSLCGVGF